MQEAIPPTRAAALQHLATFAPRMGRHYADGRNTDPGPGERRDVSVLSPHVRHRLVTESELVGTALHSGGSEKFIQEVFWRTYWKGWLQLRPTIWRDYVTRVAADHQRLRSEGGLRRAYETAANGATGIECFDAWAQELVEHGYLHNHARMWFASIWCFTLRLPWTLGADLFLRHLKDGDAASNTLSWRWVIGSQTAGKHYVATAGNIARYTDGRFDPRGELNENPAPIVEPTPPLSLLAPAAPPPTGRVALLLHEDDLGVESLDLGSATVVAIGGIAVPSARSPLGCSPVVDAFVTGALEDGLARAAERFGVAAQRLEVAGIVDWAAASGATTIVTPEAPTGWTSDRLAAGGGVPLRPLRRAWDDACWPLATKGFFPFRERIPKLIEWLRPLPPTTDRG